MKKILFFLITILGVIITSPINTYAKTYKFYEAEYIDGIWINKYNPDTKETFYQKARFFRQTDTNEFAYCIETFNFFNSNGDYITTNNPPTLTSAQKERISEIAHFGYGYKNHTDAKWYAITQFMIWKEANPNGDYYFTDSLNGNRITKFTSEINEINQLIINYNTLPDIHKKRYTHVEGRPLKIMDLNNVLKYYKSTNKDVKVVGNCFEIEYIKPGQHTIYFERTDNVYNKPVIFFNSSTSQDLVETGNIDKKQIYINLNITTTNLKIIKLDKETQNKNPQGEASLDGSVFEIFNKHNEKITEVKIINNEGNIKNLDYGTYYIKEKTPGKGYKLNENVYKAIVSSNRNPEIIIDNEIIKSNIIINKMYKFNNKLIPEKNIKFNIFDRNNNLIKTITTDENGNVQIELPYGEYTLKQLTTTEGYTKIEPLKINVKSEQDIIIKLENYKIKVPNTYIEKNIFEKILSFIKKIIC